jgi:hypothetical protein
MYRDCGSCNFVRRTEGRWCCAMCGERLRVIAATLAHNLGIAGGLCRSFSLGHVRGLFRPSIDDSREIVDEYERTVWRAGTGKAAP